MNHPDHHFAYVTCDFQGREFTATWTTAEGELHLFFGGGVERVPL